MGANLFKWLRNSLGVVLLPLVIILVYTKLRGLDWQAVGEILSVLLEKRALLALTLIIMDYLILTCYDLLALSHLKNPLSAPKVLPAAFVSFVVNFNFGAIVGAGFRYHLYSLLGLKPAVIGRLIVIIVITNWLGFGLLAGLTFTFTSPISVGRWISEGILYAVGIVSLLLFAGYLLISISKKSLSIGGQKLPLLDHPFLWVQLVLSVSHWLLVSGIVYVLWSDIVVTTYIQVLAAYLFTAIAGVILRVPGGLGVIEAVFVEIFGAEIGREAVVAGIFAFRILYQLLPLILAAFIYGIIAVYTRRNRSMN